MALLSNKDIFAVDDIDIKKVDVPEWNGHIYIKQLSRRQQDQYFERQFGNTKMKQDRRAKAQEISAVNLYGHDAWIVVQAACDDKGQPLFSPADEKKLAAKNGEVVGRIAKEILEFSGMGGDVEELEELKN